MKKQVLILMFLVLAIVLVFSIVGIGNKGIKDTHQKTNTQFFSDSSKVVNRKLEDEKIEKKGKEEIINKNEQEQVKEEGQYIEKDIVINDSSNNDISSSSNNQNSSQSTSMSSSESHSISDSQSNSQAKNEVSFNSNNDNDSVDTNHPDYYIHRGIIDCEKSSDCLDKSVKIKLEYKKSIDYSNFVEVYAKNGSVLGYFIEYVFKEHTYSSYDECNSFGTKIKNALENRITGYTCNVDGTLKINTIY